jgi:DNA-binding NarL/FixJ family response regulator
VSAREIRTLVVDDQADVRLLVQCVIDQANDGLTVTGVAASGEEAIALADELDPCVIVLDERMPGMSGLEAAEQIRERRPNQRFIVFSAHLDSELAQRAQDAGIETCLGKEELFALPDACRAVAVC